MNNRNIEKHIKFNSDEYEIVRKKAERLKIPVGRYIRQISVQGELKIYDMKELQHLIRSFNGIGVNLNQIATVANSTKSIYQKDIEDLQEQFKYFDKVMKNYLHELEPNVLL